MFYIIENGKITGSSVDYLSSENGTTIQKDFTQEEINLINLGGMIELIDGVWTVSYNQDCNCNLAIEKSRRVLEIEKEIRALGATGTTSTFISSATTSRIEALRIEKTALETEIDNLVTGLPQDELDEILNALFA